MVRLFLGLALAVLPSASLDAVSWQPDAIDSAVSQAPDIVVTGRQADREQLHDFMEEITVESPGDQLAAFRDPVCPHVAGLDADHARFIAARMLDVAETVGARAADTGCAPNLLVFFSADPRALIAEMHALRRGELFAGLSAFEIGRIRDSEEPTTQWNIFDVRGADGREMKRVSSICFSPIACWPVDLHVLEGVQPSRITMSTRRDIAASIIVVDIDALEGASLLQIADYLAMRTLARTRSEGGMTYSILSLLDDLEAGRAPQPQASPWDLAYLHALYATDRTVSASRQLSSMSRIAEDTLGGAQVDGEQPARR